MQWRSALCARWAPGMLAPLGVALGVLLTGCTAGGAVVAHTPAPTRIAAQAGEVSLCEVISPAEFALEAGVTANQVNAGTGDDPLTGLQEVYCIYLDTSTAGQTTGRGTINYEVASDAPAALTVFQTVRRSFTHVENVRGVGDAAFAGTPAGAPGGTGLVVVRGRLLLYLSTGGDQATVERVTERLAALVLSRVA